MAASILTLLGACSTVSKTFKEIRKIRNAPNILHSLNNEIADLQVVLLEIHGRREDLFRKEPASLSKEEWRLLDHCHGLLERTWAKVREADGLIRASLKRTGTGVRLDSLLILRETSKLARLQTSIRGAKQDIENLWSEFDRQHAAQTERRLISIQENGTEIRRQLHEDNLVFRDDHQRMDGKLDQIIIMQGELLSSLQHPVSISISTSNSTNALSDTEGTGRLDVALTPMPYHGSNINKKYQCRNRFFHSIQGFLGDLFLGYAAASVFRKHSPSTWHDIQLELTLVYSFPIWFLNYVMALRFRHNRVCGLHCQIYIRPVIPHSHVAWDLVETGNVGALKSLLASGQIALETCDAAGNGLLFVSL